MSMDPNLAHQASLIAQAHARVSRNPQGYFTATEFQWGVVDSVNAGPPPTVSVYLDGTQTLNDTNYLTPNIRYLADYYPTVGDVVIVRRGVGLSLTDRVVMGKLAGEPTPTFTPFCGVNSSSEYIVGPNGVWGGSGVPPSTLGSVGDYYFRTDTPSTSGQRLYVLETGGWTATSL
jgi:hypothetical protein